MSDWPDWQTLLRQALATSSGDATTMFAQLATVAPDGGPAVRTVRIRSFLPDGGLVWSSDLRADKVRDLTALPVAELCWYFSATRQQFRLRGPAQVAGPDASGAWAELRAEVWRGLSDAARQSCFGPAPGTPYNGSPEPVVDASRMPETYGVIVLRPARVDLLDLRTQPHTRGLFEHHSGGWHRLPLNP